MITRAQILGTYPRNPVDGVLPYGRRMILPLCLAVLAFTFAMVASFHCSFFVAHKQFSQVITGFGFQHTTEGFIKVGIWTTQEDWEYAPLADSSQWKDQYATEGWQTYDKSWIAGSPTCVDWDLSHLGKLPDRPAKFARMLSVFIVLIGGPLVVLMVAYALYHPIFGMSPTLSEQLSELPRRKDWPEISLLHIMAAGCCLEGLLHLILLGFLATDACSEDRVDSCKLSTAGYMTILSSFSWMGAAIALWLVGHRAVPIATQSDVVCIKEGEGSDDDANESTESSDKDEIGDEGTVVEYQEGAGNSLSCNVSEDMRQTENV